MKPSSLSHAFCKTIFHHEKYITTEKFVNYYERELLAFSIKIPALFERG